MNNFLQKGIAKIQEATTADHAGDYETATSHYMHGLEYFECALKRASPPSPPFSFPPLPARP